MTTKFPGKWDARLVRSDKETRAKCFQWVQSANGEYRRSGVKKVFTSSPDAPEIAARKAARFVSEKNDELYKEECFGKIWMESLEKERRKKEKPEKRPGQPTKTEQYSAEILRLMDHRERMPNEVARMVKDPAFTQKTATYVLALMAQKGMLIAEEVPQIRQAGYRVNPDYEASNDK